jgi:hypothetical protein
MTPKKGNGKALQEVLQFLTDCGAQSKDGIARALSLSDSNAEAIITRLRRRNKLRIVDWEQGARGRPAGVYAPGHPRYDAPEPQRLSQSERCKVWRENKRRKLANASVFALAKSLELGG